MRKTLVLSFALLACPAAGAELHGAAVAVDGDTLHLNGAELRLYGIDAPELHQECGNPPWPCGKEAHDALAALVAGRKATCRARDVDRYGRIVATCTAGGQDVAEALVRQGLAIAYRRYSGRYVPAEDEARQARRGLWSGPFETPEDWRRRNPR